MIENLGKATGDAISALKEHPILLALVLFQFLLLGIVAWTAHDVRTLDKERFALVMQQCGPK